MKRNSLLIALITFMIFCISCEPNEQKMQVIESREDIIQGEFTKSKSEIKMTLDSLGQCFKDKDVEKLLTYHLYTPKYSVFSYGKPRLTPQQHEMSERKMFDFFDKFDIQMLDLKIDVFGDVGIATYIADIKFIKKGNTSPTKTLITMVFVNTASGWKITHEHASPLNSQKKVE